ncbi:unnamed protein product [Notodromas monacha]|uniref:Uncharacterized protein n=1 Tax=Notodromas monacha TaxID=399045 RepID=A0A7R9GCA0_9CRUS|nr:unnamed protein product [Notodromas monacha]CAG0917419.1 unnamed protein product [Notodromas monacha]
MKNFPQTSKKLLRTSTSLQTMGSGIQLQKITTPRNIYRIKEALWLEEYQQQQKLVNNKTAIWEYMDLDYQIHAARL